MGKMDIGSFMKDAKGGGNTSHFNLKEKGKGIVFLHPDSGIFKRNVYWYPWYGKVEENGKKVMRTHDIMITCPGMDKNPINAMRKALREDKDIDMDEVILKVGKGDQMQEYTKGDIIGEEGYDWKKSLAYKTEYLFGVIDKENPKEVHAFVAPKSLGKKITKVIEDQIEEEGEEDGNPFLNPYAFKLTFDKTLSPTDMYNAVWNKFEPTEEILALIEGDGPDLQPLTEVSSIEKIAYLIRESLVYDEDELGLDLSAADDFDPKELVRGGSDEKDEKDKKGKKGKKQSDDEDEDEPEEKPKKGKGKDKKGKKKVEPEPEDDDDDDDNDNDDEPEEEPEEKPKKNTKTGKGKTTKEDKKPKGKGQKPPLKDEDDDPEEEEVIECPECDEEIPADSETCPECGSDVTPF